MNGFCTALRTTALGVALVLTAHAAPSMAQPVAARAECAPQNLTIYYPYEADELGRSAAPIIEQIADHAARCQQAGGALRRIAIVGYPDRSDVSASGDETARARSQAVRAALIAKGLPRGRIKLINYRHVSNNPDRIMRRRAEISVTFR